MEIRTEEQVKAAKEFVEKGNELLALNPTYARNIMEILNDTQQEIDLYEEAKEKVFDEMEDNGFELVSCGDRVKDKITGFEGIVTSRAKYLHGCVRCVVESTALVDGKPMDGYVFDEGRLEVLEKEAVKGYSAPAATGPGGPRDYPAGNTIVSKPTYPGR